MVAANTARSKAYIQALLQNDLLLNFVLIMEEETSQTLPGQGSAEKQAKDADGTGQELEMLGLRFRPEESLQASLKRSNVHFLQIQSRTPDASGASTQVRSDWLTNFRPSLCRRFRLQAERLLLTVFESIVVPF